MKGGARIVDHGKFGKALNLDGIDGYAVVKLSDDIEKVLEKAFTVGYWLFVRKGRIASGVWKGEQVGWGPKYTFRLVTRSNVSLSWGTSSGQTENWFNTINAIEPNKWFYVCLTVDGTQAIGYVTLEGGKTEIPYSMQGNPRSAPAPYNLFPDRPLEMGRGVGIGDHIENVEYLDGMIDEVIIWNRALTKEEVKVLGEQEKRPTGLAVEANGKLATTWGQVKFY